MQNSYEEAIWIDGGSNITIKNLTIENVQYPAVCIHGGAAQTSGQLNCMNSAVGIASNDTVTGIEVNGSIGTTYPQSWQSGLAAWGNVPNTTFSHNYVHNVAGTPISIRAYAATGDNISNALVTGNAILNTQTGINDSGCIYYEDLLATSTNLIQSGNFCRDRPGANNAGNDGQGTHCYYLDAATSNATIINNVCANAGNGVLAGSSLTLNICGDNNTFTNNILDLGTASYTFMNLYGMCGPPAIETAMTGNSITNNIIIANYSGRMTSNWAGVSGYTYITGGTAPGTMTKSNNMYYNYGGGTPNTSGNQGSDTSPVIADPLFVAGQTLYTLSSNSPAYNAVGSGGIGFKPIPGGWGPPGFVMPDDSNAPVSYH